LISRLARRGYLRAHPDSTGYACANIAAAAAWIVPARFAHRRFGPVGCDQWPA
jgi:hypothetical protein